MTSFLNQFQRPLPSTDDIFIFAIALLALSISIRNTLCVFFRGLRIPTSRNLGAFYWHYSWGLAERFDSFFFCNFALAPLRPTNEEQKKFPARSLCTQRLCQLKGSRLDSSARLVISKLIARSCLFSSEMFPAAHIYSKICTLRKNNIA